MLSIITVFILDLQVTLGSLYRKNIVETIATIDMETECIFTQNDALEDAAMILAPTTGWEQLLSSTPMNLAFLGQLLLLSLKTDFPLHGSNQAGGLRLLRHPTSFRASIIQVIVWPGGYSGFVYIIPKRHGI